MKLIFRVHAIQRMFERSISISDVTAALSEPIILEEYYQDFPFPSKLVIGYVGARPLHVVFADDLELSERIIITVYEPNETNWQDDYRKRKL